MFIEISATTSIEDLVLAGAAVDGKITQQVALIKKGLNIPRTIFFTYEDVNNNIESLLKLAITDENSEYQIRTETPNETNRAADFFSESRLGLRYNQLEENLLSVCKNKIVGIIQQLPEKSLSRNIVSGLATVTKNGTFHLDFLNGIATYTARVGTCDGSLIAPLSKLDNIQKYLNIKPKNELFENLLLTIWRFGIKELQNSSLPYNSEHGRIKKEYEITIEELNENFDAIPKIEFPNKIKEDFEVYCGLDFSKHNLKTALTIAGLNVIMKGDDQNATKLYILGRKLEHKTFKFIVDNVLKLGDFILESHIVSFSVIESNSKCTMLIWDLPLDKPIEETSNETTNINWITSMDNLTFQEPLGINLPFSTNINDDLLNILSKVKKSTDIETIYIKYSILSHLATLIRESGFKVIKVKNE